MTPDTRVKNIIISDLQGNGVKLLQIDDDGLVAVSSLDATGGGFVPYTGAITNVNLGSYKLTSTGVTSNADIRLKTGKKFILDG